MPKAEIDRAPSETSLASPKPEGQAPVDPKPAANEPAQSGEGDRIGSELRRIYEDVANEPLPDRFRDLLDRLKQESGDGDA